MNLGGRCQRQPVSAVYRDGQRALGGIGAVGQLQLLQPFFGLALAATLLGEAVSLGMIAVTVAIVGCVAGAKRYAG